MFVIVLRLFLLVLGLDFCLCDEFLTYNFHPAFFVLSSCSSHSLSFYYGSLLAVIVCDQYITYSFHPKFWVLGLVFPLGLGLGFCLG